MTIRFACPQCSAPASAPDQVAGRETKCRQCRAPLTVPLPSAIPLPPDDPSPKPGQRPRSRKASESKTWLLTGLGIGLLFFVGTIGYAVLIRNRPNGGGGNSTSSVGLESKPGKQRLDARTESAVEGDLTLSVAKAGVARVQLISLGQLAESDDKQLIIILKAQNTSDSRFVDYSSWGNFDGLFHTCTLKDDLGNQYRLITYGFGTKPVGRADDTRIRPLSTTQDALVFDPPVAKAKELYLRVSLPNGTAEFVIPVSAVIR